MRPQGIITALITPLDVNGELCVDCLKELIEFQYKSGIVGLYLTGTYGEGVILPLALRLRVFEKALEYAPTNMYLLPHIGAASYDAIIELGLKVRDLGYKDVSVVGPIYHKPSRRGLVEFYEYIASKTELNILVYNNPGRQGYNITPDDFQLIVDRVKSVVGIKDTSRDVDVLLEYVKRFGDRYFVAGAGDSFLLYTFMIGASAHVCGISNFIPEVTIALYKAIRDGNYGKAVELQYQLNQVRRILSKLAPETQEVLRELMRMRGLRAGYPPLHLMYDLDRGLLEKAFKLSMEIVGGVRG
jgi:4-hydroxy-tetrahydrodipicolinate synthase